MTIEVNSPDSGINDVPHAAYPTDWAEQTLQLAHRLEADLGSDERFEGILGELQIQANRLGCEMVTGASGLGHQLAGALAHRSAGTLRLWVANGAAGTMLIVDGVLATGVQLGNRASAAKRSGATRVVGAVAIATDEGLEAARQMLGDEVIALRTASLLAE